MSRRIHFWFTAFQDLDKPVGGVKQLHRTCECLELLGHDATLIQNNVSSQPFWFSSYAKKIAKDEWISNCTSLSSSTNVLVLPETYLPALNKWAPQLPKIIFNQNSAYTFGASRSPKVLKVSVARKLYNSTRQIWCVSEYDRRFLSSLFDVNDTKVFRIYNSIDSSRYPFPCQKKRQIAFMPRKNSKHSSIVIPILSSMKIFQDWKFVPIHMMSQSEVFSVLADSSLFLSFGHPEGFGLPVAEAMSLGCMVVGYSGLGGQELFDIGQNAGTCWKVEFGDLLNFVQSVVLAIESLPQENISKQLLSVAKSIRENYNQTRMVNSIENALDSLYI